MKSTTKIHIFIPNHKGPGIQVKGAIDIGVNHPPKKRITVIPLISSMLAYSPKKKIVFKPKGNLKKISSSPLKNSSIEINFLEGDKVSHEKFGLGKIVKIEGLNNDVRAIVEFSKFGQKNLLLRFAKLNKI